MQNYSKRVFFFKERASANGKEADRTQEAGWEEAARLSGYEACEQEADGSYCRTQGGRLGSCEMCPE